MKSPRDGSMILVAILSAGAVVVAAGLTSGHAFSSLVRGTEAEAAGYAADTLELPVELNAEAGVAAGTDGANLVAATAAEATPAADVDDLSPVVVEQVKSEMTRLGALPGGVPERVQALADQVSDGAGKTVVIVYWDEAGAGGAAWTHTRVAGGEALRSTESGPVLEHVEAWIAEQTVPAQYEVILQD